MKDYKNIEQMSLLNHTAFHEMVDIEQWLEDNDYKINKYIVGEYTDSSTSWLAYKTERNTKLIRLREIQEIFKDIL